MKILIVAGTRPEIIKCAPIYLAAKNDESVQVAICNTGQHEEMSNQALEIFQIFPEYDLKIMKVNQHIHHIINKISEKLPPVLLEYMPDYVVVQGDTTTAMVAGLIAFNLRIKVVHLEAGLRTGNLLEPFPEESNRRVISAFAYVHLCPTSNNVNSLYKENININVYQVGNSVVDALNIVQKIDTLEIPSYVVDKIRNKKYILVTSHRRENFGRGIEDICDAIYALSKKFPTIYFIFPVHHNPNIKDVVYSRLGSAQNVVLIKPVNYFEMLALIKNCLFCLTDSGGIQEESPSFGKYSLVLRNYTERSETIEAGYSELVGTDKRTIIDRVTSLLEMGSYKLNNLTNPYGEGTTSKNVVNILKSLYYSK